MDAITAVTLSTLVWKLVEFVKRVNTGRKTRDWEGALTQVVAWVGGVAIVFLAAQADVAGAIAIWDTTLGELDSWSLVLLGLALSSLGGAAVEVKKAIDNKDDARQPSLFGQPPAADEPAGASDGAVAGPAT